MDAGLYESILADLNGCSIPHVNEEILKFLRNVGKYQGLSTETLRSIIGLWYTRKVAALSSRLNGKDGRDGKGVDVYKMYKDLTRSGNPSGCFAVAEKTGYSPALIAKIVLTRYLDENQKNKPKVDAKKAKQLRKPECAFCIARKAEISVKLEDTISIKKHNDPRIELALNLFDDDDDIGKYFLDKLKYSGDTKSSFGKTSTKSQSNKFYWQASAFEQMGEKNVMNYKNIERLFANPNSAEESSNDLKNTDSVSGVVKRTAFSRINTITPVEMNNSKPLGRGMLLAAIEKRRTFFKIKDLLDDFDDIKIEGRTSENINPSAGDESSECSPDYPPEYPPSPDEQKRCTCNVFSSSDDTDSDSDPEETWDNVSVRELLENTSLIEDPILAQDVLHCTIIDDQYGPTSDIIANCLGVRYERILEEYVKKAGLPYRTENKLRGLSDKTPDIILLVPVAVDGFVINWIESKALFADREQHRLFKNSQFENYTNRFGPGFVIYWHGYVDDIPGLYLAKKKIIVRDRFPPKESFTFVKSDKFKSWMQSESNFS